MAQTRRRRRRKHRGTQGGSVDRRRRRPRSREEARAQARRQQQSRRERPPTWRSAVNRALLMSAILFGLFVLVLGRPAGASFVLAATMLVIYVPAGYYLERFLYKRRMAIMRRAREKEAAR